MHLGKGATAKRRNGEEAQRRRGATAKERDSERARRRRGATAKERDSERARRRRGATAKERDGRRGPKGVVCHARLVHTARFGLPRKRRGRRTWRMHTHTPYSVTPLRYALRSLGR